MPVVDIMGREEDLKLLEGKLKEMGLGLNADPGGIESFADIKASVDFALTVHLSAGEILAFAAGILAAAHALKLAVKARIYKGDVGELEDITSLPKEEAAKRIEKAYHLHVMPLEKEPKKLLKMAGNVTMKVHCRSCGKDIEFVENVKNFEETTACGLPCQLCGKNMGIKEGEKIDPYVVVNGMFVLDGTSPSAFKVF